MRASSFIAVILLLVLMVGMIGMIPVQAGPTTLYVNPANTIDNTLQPQASKAIKPMADGTFTDWTGRTLTIRPDGDGTYRNWTGRILTLNPSDDGTFGAWPATIPPITLSPRANGIYTGWNATHEMTSYSDWDDWPTPDGDTTKVFTKWPNVNETSILTFAPIEPRAYAISKVTLTIVAKCNVTSDERVRLMLVVGGKGYNGSIYGLTTSYVTYTSDWLTSPATGSAWTWTELDGMEAGVRSEKFGATWTGELRVTQLYVSVLLRDYAAWTDWPDNNGDTDYVSANADALQESSALPNHSSENWSILKVRVTIVAKTDISTNEMVALMLVIGGTPWLGASYPLTTAYKEYSSEWSLNPNGNIPWTWTAIDALEAGVQSIKVGGWTGIIKVTQLYVKVIESGTFANWSEATPDGDGAYLSALSNKLNQSSTLQDSGGEAWGIARVQVSIIARTDIPSDEQVTLMLVVGGTQYSGDTYMLTNTYSTYSTMWTLNPNGNVPWTWIAIDTLQAGVKSLQFDSAWTGEIRVTQLFVVVAEVGTYTNWDDWPDHDSDTSYVSATMDSMKESSALENIGTYPTWTIARVRVVAYAKTDVATDEQVQMMLVVGGIEYLGAAYTLDTTYAKCIGDWGRNPATGSFWTWAEIDALEAGVNARVSDDGIWSGELRVTQLYVEVAGPRFSVGILVDSVTDLYGYDFTLNYTTAVATATAITLGSFFPYDSTEWKKEINDDLGYVRYIVSMPSGSPGGMTGSGTLATIDFLADSYGDSLLILSNIKLSDHLSKPITFTAYDGYFSNKMPGDVNADKAVNVTDVFYVGRAYGSDSSDPNWNWNIRCDFNGDGIVNNSDLSALNQNYGKTFPS